MSARRARVAAPAIAAMLAACGAAPGGAPPVPGIGPSAREDRVLLTAFDVVRGVALTSRTVYIASAGGIAARDRVLDQWLPPATRLDGYPGGTVTAIAPDPVEDAVWVALDGAIVDYRPALDMVTSTTIPGIADVITFDARDPGAGAYVHATGGWSLVTRTGLATPAGPGRVPAPNARVRTWTLRDIYAAYPALQGSAPILARDADLRSWPVIAGGKAPNESDVWLGTNGGGVFRVDPVTLTSRQVPFGLIETGTGALAASPDGVWMAGVGRSLSGRAGLTFASRDLQQWRWVEGPVTRPLGAALANRLAVAERDAWVATNRGLVLLDTEDRTRALTWNLANGLPSDAALSVAAGAGGAWAGTERGLVFVSDTGLARAGRAAAVTGPWLGGTPVRALLLRDDTLWIGSDDGLRAIPGASAHGELRAPAIADSRLREPILALARSDSLLAVATERELVVLDLPHREVVRAFDAVDVGRLRGVTALAMDARTIWVGGVAGVLVVSRPGGAARMLSAPGDVPDAVNDILLDPDFAWIATRAGVLRVRRASDGGVR